MGKLLFSIALNEKNVFLRDLVSTSASRYLSLSHSQFFEIGIGNGRFGKLLGASVEHYYGIDIDKTYVKIARTNIPKGARVSYRYGDALNIPYRRKFDVLFYANSWHFISDFDRALDEADRVLKPKGIIMILEPAEDSKEWSDPRLRRDSKEFVPQLLRQKVVMLNEGRKAIEKQKRFKIMEGIQDKLFGFNFYILSRV